MPKIEALGIGGELPKWNENLLCDPKQIVVNRQESEWFPLISGIIQGPVLEPDFYYLYYVDLFIFSLEFLN